MTNTVLNFADLRDAFWRLKKRVVGTFVGFFALILAVLLALPNSYVSEAKVLLRVGRSSISVDPTVTVGETVTTHESREREVLTELELLRSRELSEYVVDTLGVDTILASAIPNPLDKLLALWEPEPDDNARRRQAVKMISRAVSASATRNVNVIGLECKASSPEFAQKILTVFVDGYKKRHSWWNQSSDSHQFFVREADETRKQLDMATNELRQAKDHLSVGSVDGEKSLINMEIGNLERDIVSTRGAMLSEETTVNTIKKNFPKFTTMPLTAGATSPLAVDHMRSELYKLQILKADLSAKYSSDHPALRAATEQMQEAEQLLARHEMQAAMNNINQFSAKLQALNEKLAAAKAKQLEINALEARMRSLDEQVARLSDMYQKYATRVEESRIGKALSDERFTNIQVAQAPTFEPKHAWPKRSMWLALGTVAAGIAAAAVFRASLLFGGTATMTPRLSHPNYKPLAG